MSNINKSVHEPLFHVAKRDNLKTYWKIAIYAAAILISLFIGGLFISLTSNKGTPFKFFDALIEGCFGTERKTWNFVQQLALLLAVSMALVPAFKMKFWNLGANGQILMGGLAAIACMKYMGEAGVGDEIIIPVSLLASILAGAIWAVIPAICKAIWNTNESLFTLMLNYIASGLITYFIAVWVKNGSGVLPPLPYGNLPEIVNKYFTIIVVGFAITIFMFIYLKYSKHGYELSVVGDSQNTAKYIGINVKKVIIRTLVLSGGICGIVGYLLTAGMNPTIGVNTAQNMGFTAIMTTWLGNCNPLMIIATCSLVAFISKGMTQAQTVFGLTSDSTTNFVIGFVYFFIIACSFFIEYKIMFNKKKQTVENTTDTTSTLNETEKGVN